jgi:hypothetical protein
VRGKVNEKDGVFFIVSNGIIPMQAPALIEPATNRFFNHALHQMHLARVKHYEFWRSMRLGILFVLFWAVVFIFRYNGGNKFSKHAVEDRERHIRLKLDQYRAQTHQTTGGTISRIPFWTDTHGF